MRVIDNIVAIARTRAALLTTGVKALAYLVKAGFTAIKNGAGPIKQRLAALAKDPEAARAGFALLRAFWPNLALPVVLLKAYESNGTVIVTRAEDVFETLDRDADFEVVYEPRMRQLTGGENFFLGMQNSAPYEHDVSIMRLIMPRTDVDSIVLPLVRAKTQEYAGAHAARIDLPQDLTLRVPAAIVADYFGTPGPSEQDMISWASLLFWWLFLDATADAVLSARALDAAQKLCAAVDADLAARKASGAQKDDLLGRALTLQKSRPEFTDLAIRNNLVGIIIGAIPTISMASCQAVDQLLNRPEALAGAEAAAKAGDEALLGAYLFEALRFFPINPVIFRRATRDTAIAASSWRACKVKKGNMVLASNLSAMFDPLKIDDPESFRVDRPWGDYILWGYGLHACFGAYINKAVIPAMLLPVLARDGLRRAVGAPGQIQRGDTPFPQHFTLENA
jgi:cytochrome P450